MPVWRQLITVVSVSLLGAFAVWSAIGPGGAHDDWRPAGMLAAEDNREIAQDRAGDEVQLDRLALVAGSVRAGLYRSETQVVLRDHDPLRLLLSQGQSSDTDATKRSQLWAGGSGFAGTGNGVTTSGWESGPTFRSIVVGSNGRAQFIGHGTPGTQVALSVGGQALAPVFVNSSGKWRVEPDRYFAPGDYSITAVEHSETQKEPRVGQDVRIAIPRDFSGRDVAVYEARSVQPRESGTWEVAQSAGEDASSGASSDPEPSGEDSSNEAAFGSVGKWLNDSAGEFQGVVVRHLSTGAGTGSSSRGQSTSQTKARPPWSGSWPDLNWPDVGLPRVTMPDLGVGTSLFWAREWLARANRDFQRKVMRKLSVGSPGELATQDDDDAGAKKDTATADLVEPPPPERKPKSQTLIDAEVRRQADALKREREQAEADRLAAVLKESESDKRNAANAEAERLAVAKAQEDARKAVETAAAARAQAQARKEEDERANKLTIARLRAAAADRRRKADADANLQAREAARKQKAADKAKARAKKTSPATPDRIAGDDLTEDERAREFQKWRKARNAWRAAKHSARGVVSPQPEAEAPSALPGFTEDDTRSFAENAKLAQAEAAARRAEKKREVDEADVVPSKPVRRKVSIAKKRKKLRSKKKRKLASAKRRTRVKGYKKRLKRKSYRKRKYSKKRRWRKSRCRVRAGRRVKIGRKYTVRRGDSLWRIAKRHYGNGRLYRRIYRANRRKIGRSRIIYPCQRLRIPRR